MRVALNQSNMVTNQGHLIKMGAEEPVSACHGGERSWKVRGEPLCIYCRLVQYFFKKKVIQILRNTLLENKSSFMLNESISINPYHPGHLTIFMFLEKVFFNEQTVYR